MLAMHTYNHLKISPFLKSIRFYEIYRQSNRVAKIYTKGRPKWSEIFAKKFGQLRTFCKIEDSDWSIWLTCLKMRGFLSENRGLPLYLTTENPNFWCIKVIYGTQWPGLDRPKNIFDILPKYLPCNSVLYKFQKNIKLLTKCLKVLQL